MILQKIAALHSATEDVARLLYTNGCEGAGYEALVGFTDGYGELLEHYPLPLLAEHLPLLLEALRKEDMVGLCDTLLLHVQPLLEALYAEIAGGAHE